MQQAIDDPRNEIPSASVRRWVRDVVTDVSAPEIFEMLVRHYSMADDTVHVANWDVASKSFLERLVVPINLQLARAETSTFWSSPIFQRYVYNRPPSRNETAVDLGTDGFSVLHADSASALQEFQPGSFDVAITSPPYFNAREYSQWPNVYCYLYDLFNVTREVYRTLKAGAYYWFNLFDYFDNENTTVFSAMGEKRMILSAYVVDLFRRVGFESIGNVVWDKGDIQGKRGFNAGNFSPYYQSPFNCWEHILVFRKPNGHRDEKFHSRVWRQSPVIKMVRGRNVHGHSAPFPDALPELAIKGLAAEAVVLDPYAGSLTTGRVAARHGLRSVSVEILEDYCRLGLNMQADEARARARNDAQLRAFDS